MSLPGDQPRLGGARLDEVVGDALVAPQVSDDQRDDDRAEQRPETRHPHDCPFPRPLALAARCRRRAEFLLPPRWPAPPGSARTAPPGALGGTRPRPGPTPAASRPAWPAATCPLPAKGPRTGPSRPAAPRAPACAPTDGPHA